MKGYFIYDDENSFIFSLRSNNRLEKPEKFMIKPNESKNSFALFNNDDDYLFYFGEGPDICIYKTDK